MNSKEWDKRLTYQLTYTRNVVKEASKLFKQGNYSELGEVLDRAMHHINNQEKRNEERISE